jgi:hypothetical protein
LVELNQRGTTGFMRNALDRTFSSPLQHGDSAVGRLFSRMSPVLASFARPASV